MGAPYLGQQYIAASLMHAGHEVRVLDCAAPHFPGGDDAVVTCAERFGPDLIGMTVFTYSAAAAYQLAGRLKGVARLLVCGGPHPTVCPAEPTQNGFDVALSGEGEALVVALANRLDAGLSGPQSLHGLAGITTAQGSGPAWSTLDDLDALAFPLASYPLYDMSWYVPGGGPVVPGGLMTSRGCPARCTFCANYVTGRSYRFRTPKNVVAEMRALRERFGVMHFPFWDDAFTALRPRLNDLCDAIIADEGLRNVTWTCITPGNMVKPHDLARMRKAGCVAINFGLESGDYNILRVIQKGQRPEHVKAAVQAARAEGMTTIVNFMFGFPGEGTEELKRTLDLMAELAPYTDFFNNRGVLVPFPGTAIYDQHAAAYQLEGWWLDPAMVPIEPDLHAMSAEDAMRALESDPTLDLDFFGYSDAVKLVIAEGVAFKAQHNYSTVRRLQGKPAA